MATLNYYFRLTKEEKEALKNRRKIEKPKRVLYARLRDTDIDIPVSLGLKLDIANWNENKQQLNLSKGNSADFDEVNNKLRDFKTKIDNEAAKALVNGIDIDKNWFEKQIKDFFNKSIDKSGVDINIYFIDYVKHFIERSRTKRVNSAGKPIGKSSARCPLVPNLNCPLKKLYDYS
jgi:hypothetical protein